VTPLKREFVWDTLRHDIIEQIRGGTFKSDEPILPTGKLSEEYGISTVSVRRAIDELVKEGWLYRKRHVGAFVSSSPPADQERPGTIKVIVFEPSMQPHYRDYVQPLESGLQDVLDKDHIYTVRALLTDQRWEAYLDDARPPARAVVVTELSSEKKPTLMPIFARKKVALVTNETATDDSYGFHYDCVSADHRQAARAATLHLVELGHRRIAHVAGSRSVVAGCVRREGYLSALREAGIASGDELVRETNWLIEDAYGATRELLELDDPPTAFFASSDTLAFGVLRALRERALRVPDDVSVVGCDDLEMSSHTDPPLTTIRTPREQIGRMMGQLLLDRIAHPDKQSSAVLLQTQLIVRESTGPPPEGE